MAQRELTGVNIANGVFSGLMLAWGLGAGQHMLGSHDIYEHASPGFTWLISGFLGILATLLKQKEAYITQMVFCIYSLLDLFVFIGLSVGADYAAFSMIMLVPVTLFVFVATVLCGILACAKRDSLPVVIQQNAPSAVIVQNQGQLAAYQAAVQSPGYIVQYAPVVQSQLPPVAQNQLPAATQPPGYIQSQTAAVTAAAPPAYTAQPART